MSFQATNKAIIKRLEKEKAKIAKNRDALRELLSDAADIEESCNEALCDIERAIDALSKYV